MKHLLLALIALFLTSTAEAATAWVYRIERASFISGGKLKIYDQGNGAGYKKLRLKYKLDTAAGFKESWLPYNLPGKVFDPKFLASLVPGEIVDLGNVPHGWESKDERFQIVRETQSAFLISSSEGQFRIYPRNKGGAWKRIEFTIRGGVTLRLNGNLEEVVKE
jgi:hypothetical protein